MKIKTEIIGKIVWMIIFMMFAIFLLIKHFENPGYWNILSSFDLAIHEAGHLFLFWAGDNLQILGGTIFQLLFPIIFLGYFVNKKEMAGIMFSMTWLGENLFNVAYYIADASTRLIPLLGDDIDSHDWWNLLGNFNLLSYDKDISKVVNFVGIVCMFLTVMIGFYSIAILFYKKECGGENV
jgi:hypothetical protein